MRSIPLLSLLLFSVLFSFAQKKAITETGEEVVLYDDGTWKYSNDSLASDIKISTNPKAFKKKTTSTFLLKSTNFNVGVWLDPKKWGFKKATNNDAAEYELTLKGKDLYGMMIAEGVEIPVETLTTIAVDNAKEAAPDIKVVKQEYRTVNDVRVLCMQMNGTMQGIKFTYYGYYFSNANGTLQFITYTAQNLFEKYLPEIEDLLNGLVQLE